MPDAVELVDGSGLSYKNRATPRLFTTYLSKFPTTPAGRGFPQLLPANGSGTLHQLASGLPASGVVRAKTGTLQDVSNVVGYLGRPNGVLLVALFYEGPRASRARQAQWRLFRVLGADGVMLPADPCTRLPWNISTEPGLPTASKMPPSSTIFFTRSFSSVHNG